MGNGFKYTGFGCMALIVILLSAANLFGGIRLDQPQAVYYHRFVSAVTGPEATWVNPAGLGLDRRLKIQYIARFLDGDFTNDWGTVVSGDGIGLSFRSVESFRGGKYVEYIYAAGAGVGKGLYWGCSYRYIKEGFGYYYKRHFWNIGLLYNRHPQYTLGALFSNLNRGKVNGEKTDIEQIYSASYKTKNERFTISVEISLSSKQSLSGAKYNYGVDWQAKPNFKIFANYSNDRFYQIGFRLDLKDYFFGTQSQGEAKNNTHLGTSVYTGFMKAFTAR